MIIGFLARPDQRTVSSLVSWPGYAEREDWLAKRSLGTNDAFRPKVKPAEERGGQPNDEASNRPLPCSGG